MRPRTRARRPPWRRRSRWASLRSTLGAGCSVVGPPGWLALADATSGQLGLARIDGDHSTPNAGGAGLTQRADAARNTEPGPPTTAADQDDRHRDLGRAGHRLGLQVDAELVFGEPPARCGRDLGGDHRGQPVGVQPGQVGAGAVGAVAVEHRPSSRRRNRTGHRNGAGRRPTLGVLAPGSQPRERSNGVGSGRDQAVLSSAGNGSRTGQCPVCLTILRSSSGLRWRRVTGDRRVNEPLTA
jgi:hypothetical protein